LNDARGESANDASGAAIPLQVGQPHWYHVTYYDCPVCGGGDTIRERRAGPKPTDPAARVDYVQR
jgi:hypothetical protein